MNPFSAVIPVTDAEHNLLNVHFSVDPGPQFVWGRDEYDPGIMAGLIQLGEPAEHLSSLASYLELVKVSLPEWVLVDHQNHHQKKKVQSMAKQFGSLGKKFRKNLAKITQTVGGGTYNKRHSQQVPEKSPRIVSSSQTFILGNIFKICRLPYFR